MRFQVPQFIEHEPKVVGPLTFRQFIYLGVPGAIAFFLYFLAPFFFFVVSTVFLGAFGFLLAFIKIGGRSIPNILSNFLSFSISPKRYIWKKGATPLEAEQRQYQQPASPAGRQTAQQPQGPQKIQVQLVQKSKVRDLATKVETKK